MNINIQDMRTEGPLLAPIFRSDGQARLLSALLLGVDEISLTELASRAGVAYASAHREVGRLLDAGIVRERLAGRTRLLRANADSPLVPPLREILLIATGPAVLLGAEFTAIEGIESAFLYGSFAARMQRIAGAAPNDIDVMVIGTPDPDLIYQACDRVEQAVHRPVNPTILSQTEARADSGFLAQVRDGAVVPIVGELPWE